MRAALSSRDLLLFVVDATVEFSNGDAQAVDLVRKTQTPAVLVLNKIDLLKDKTRLLGADGAVPRAARFRRIRSGVGAAPAKIWMSCAT